MDYNTFKVDIK